MTKIDTDQDWRYSAKCYGDEPWKYELDGARGIDRDQRARELCRGCLVIQQCAIEALNPTAVGTVRAGVWIPGATAHIPRTLVASRNDLNLIATGTITADQIHAHKVGRAHV